MKKRTKLVRVKVLRTGFIRGGLISPPSVFDYALPESEELPSWVRPLGAEDSVVPIVVDPGDVANASYHQTLQNQVVGRNARSTAFHLDQGVRPTGQIAPVAPLLQ